VLALYRKLSQHNLICNQIAKYKGRDYVCHFSSTRLFVYGITVTHNSGSGATFVNWAIEEFHNYLQLGFNSKIAHKRDN
jgi:hypothetical protein